MVYIYIVTSTLIISLVNYVINRLWIHLWIIKRSIWFIKSKCLQHINCGNLFKSYINLQMVFDKLWDQSFSKSTYNRYFQEDLRLNLLKGFESILNCVNWNKLGS
jgi:hypothetical protein